jgi:hypothetical protein
VTTAAVARRHGLGYRRDPVDFRDWPFGRLGLARAAPAAASLRTHVDGVLDQDGTQSCVANAWAQALRIGDHVNGQPVPALGSVLFLYYNWRNGRLVFALCDRCSTSHDIVFSSTEAGVEVRARRRTPLLVGGGL